MRNILVSACLLGVSCRYDGKSTPCPSVIELKGKYNLIPVCPEILGGLPTPRLPSEMRDGNVFMSDGADVTNNYIRGAKEVLKIAKIFECHEAVLKENSPSCGSGSIYDGSFHGSLTKGDGITARLLKENGIIVFGESQTAKLTQK